jgi:ATP-dependent exoDNAse (exonuclease V) beta subunit
VGEYCGAALEVAERKGFHLQAKKEMDLLRASETWGELHSARWQIFSELSVLAPVTGAGWVDGIIYLVAHDRTAGQLLVIDWKTNRVRAGEGNEALLDRLAEEYRPQLKAYGACLAQFFPQAEIILEVYAAGTGQRRKI